MCAAVGMELTELQKLYPHTRGICYANTDNITVSFVPQSHETTLEKFLRRDRCLEAKLGGQSPRS